MSPTFTAADLVAAERRKQIRKGYTPEHDDHHTSAELARAGVSYAISGIWQMFGVEGDEVMVPGYPDPELEWPFDAASYNPDTEAPINNLIKAAALIEAEIDRMIRRVP